MFHLTREVRFALNGPDDPQLRQPPTNSFAAYPSLVGVNPFLAIQVTLAGEALAQHAYLRNIKEIDQVIRARVIARMPEMVGAPHAIPARLIEQLRDAWPGTTLSQITLRLSPFLDVSCIASEHPMVRLSQSFEFCASHRLHKPNLSDEENRRTFGKCNNPFGHGHNYTLKVTLRGTPGANGLLVDLPAMEKIVDEAVISRFDHKNLNVEVPEFKELNPSVENIAMVIYRTLKPKFEAKGTELSSVTVWETPKTWCEFSDEA